MSPLFVVGGGGVPSNDTEMFLRQSIQMIDDALGDGYAKRNPALITSPMPTGGT